MDDPTNEDLAMTVNAFGTLMQSTLPLFDETLTITDGEFTTIVTLSATAGAGIIAAAGGGVWWTVGATTLGGPIVVGVAGAVAVGFGIGAIVEGVKWGNRQKTNRKALYNAFCQPS